MVSHLFFYQLGLVALVWLCVMLHWVWPSAPPHARRHRSPRLHCPSARVSPNPLQASPTNLTATPVSTPPPPTCTPPQLHPRVSCLRADAAARSTPPPIAVRTRMAGTSVGRAGGIS